jgi:hypothetical protein
MMGETAVPIPVFRHKPAAPATTTIVKPVAKPAEVGERKTLILELLGKLLKGK